MGKLNLKAFKEFEKDINSYHERHTPKKILLVPKALEKQAADILNAHINSSPALADPDAWYLVEEAPKKKQTIDEIVDEVIKNLEGS